MSDVMVTRIRRRLKPVLALLFCVLFSVAAQGNAGPATPDSRKGALALFYEGKRLEALPLLEGLVRSDPNDGEVSVALAASLVEHAATVKDPDVAAKERLRAKGLLQQAWGQGYTSNLEENLRQLLGELPASGAIKFSDNPKVEQAVSDGEAAFARRDFDQALKDYGKALELEPTNYSAALFIGNTYDRKQDFANASGWYERAIRIDPNIETAYRYYADMLARSGDMAKSRSMLIQAAVAEPYNKIVWREIRAWAIINKTAFNIVYVAIPVPKASGDVGNADASTAWKKYWSVRAEWQSGTRFEQAFPQEGEYRHSLREESEALAAAAKVLETLKADKQTRQAIVGDPSATLLNRLYDGGLIESYVLFSLADDGIAKDYKAYRSRNREKLVAYMDEFVVPPAPSRH